MITTNQIIYYCLLLFTIITLHYQHILLHTDLEKSTNKSTLLPLFTDLPASRSSPWFNTISTDFVEPKNLQIYKEGYIHIAVLLKNITAANNSGFKLRINLSKWLNSLVTNTNR